MRKRLGVFAVPQERLPQSAFPHVEIHLHYTQETPDAISLAQGPCSSRNRNNCAIDAQDVEKEWALMGTVVRVFCDDLSPPLTAWPGPGWVTRLDPAGLYKRSPQQTMEGCIHTPRIVAVPEQDNGKTLWKRKTNLHLRLVRWQKKGREHVISFKIFVLPVKIFFVVFFWLLSFVSAVPTHLRNKRKVGKDILFLLCLISRQRGVLFKVRDTKDAKSNHLTCLLEI